MTESGTSQGWSWMLLPAPFFFLSFRKCLWKSTKFCFKECFFFLLSFFSFQLFEEGQGGKEKHWQHPRLISNWFSPIPGCNQILIRSSDSFSHITVQMVSKEALCPMTIIIKQYNTVSFTGWNSSLEYSGVFPLSVYSTKHPKTLQGWRSKDSLLKNSGYICLININSSSSNRRLCKLNDRRLLYLYLVDEWKLNGSLVSLLINTEQMKGLFGCTEIHFNQLKSHIYWYENIRIRIGAVCYFPDSKSNTLPSPYLLEGQFHSRPW